MNGKKRRSPKEIIENSKPFGEEHAYAKTFGNELIDVSDTPRSFSVGTNYENVEAHLKELSAKKYTHVHTHPINDRWRLFVSPDEEVKAMIYPSGADLLSFMRDNKRQVEVIAARGSSSGKVYGYLILRKTKRTPAFDIHDQNVIKPIDEYGYESYRHKSINDRQASLEKLADAYHLQFRFAGLNKKRKNMKTVAAVIGLIGGLFFLSPNITGNAIGNLSQSSANFFGLILFVVGLVGAFFWVRSRN